MKLCSLIIIICSFTFQAHSQNGPAQSSQLIEAAWSKEKVKAILAKTKTDTNALWELKEAPIELIYGDLSDLWFSGIHFGRDFENERSKGREAEWREMQKISHTDVDYFFRMLPVVRDFTLSNPNVEEFLSLRLKHYKDVLTEKSNYTDAQRKEYYAVSDVYSGELGFASLLPTDVALRLIGPFLFTVYYPDADLGDYTVSSPATVARSALAKVAKKGLHEEIPEDIEEARKWWKDNEHRFAAKPPAAPAPTEIPTPPAPTPSADSKKTSATISPLPVESKGSAASASKEFWLPITALAVAFISLLCLQRRKRL